MKVVESLGLPSEEENMVLHLRTGPQDPTGKSLSVLSPNTPASRKLSQGNNPKEKTSTPDSSQPVLLMGTNKSPLAWISTVLGLLVHVDNSMTSTPCLKTPVSS